MGKIQKAVSQTVKNGQELEAKKKQPITVLMNSLLDSEGYKKRFEELLGNRTPQFVSSIVSLVNAEPTLQKVFYEAPVTILQASLKAATFNLPIDQNLGYAYIVPFNNTVKDADGASYKRMEAVFIMGWKGMHQLALRTGVYETINVTDVREGELKSYNRLTEEIELDFIEDEDDREKAKVIGYVGYYRLINGTKKTIYMTRKQVEKHEQKHRKGQWMGKGWKDDFEAMALKTVYRRLIGKWGIMSIDYQKADKATIMAAEAIATGKFDDEDAVNRNIIDASYEVDEEKIISDEGDEVTSTKKAAKGKDDVVEVSEEEINEIFGDQDSFFDK